MKKLLLMFALLLPLTGKAQVSSVTVDQNGNVLNGKIINFATGKLSINGVLVDGALAGKQPLDSDLTSWAAITRASGFDAFVATPTLANLNSLVSDADLVPTTRTINGQALSGNIALTTTNISEGTNLYFTNARAIGSTLTGYAAGAGIITSSDSILTAIQKNAGNLAALVLPANTTATSNQFFTAYNSTTGVFTKAQPAFSDLSGSIADGQIPSGITRDSEWDTIAEIEAATGVNIIVSTEIDTSAKIRAILTDELGTGVALFDGATPTSLTLTNATGLPITTGVSGLGSGIATLLATPTEANLKLAISGIAYLDTAQTFTAAQANSANGAASLPAMRYTGTPFAGTGTTSFPLFYINDSTATASTTLSTSGTYLGVNSHGSADLMNLMKDGTSFFKVRSDGTTLTAGTITSGNALEAAASGAIDWSGRSNMFSPASGIVELTNAAATGFTRLNLGPRNSVNSAAGLGFDAVNGFTLQSGAGTTTWNDGSTATSGTVANRYLFGIAAPTLTATNTGVTDTVASTWYIGGAPTASTNTTIGTAWALYVASGNVNFAGALTLSGALNGTTIPTSKTLVVTTDKLSVHASTTSAEFAGVISNETGTGNVVLSDSPTITPESWTAPTLGNSWVNYGGAEQVIGYRKDPFGRVWIRGAIKNGATTDGTVLFTLPSGYRPGATERLVGSFYSGSASKVVSCLILITNAGDVTIYYVTDSTVLSLGGISFSTN